MSPRLRALALALLLLAPAFAVAHPGDGRPHVQSFQEIRDVKIVTTRDTVEFQLDRPSERTVDAIRVRFDSTTASFTYDYRRDDANRGSGAQYVLVMESLVEYRDQNRNRAFDPGVDTVERAWHPETFRWNVSRPRTLYVGTDTAQYVNATGYFGGGAFLSIEFVATGKVNTVARARLHPQDVKMTWNFGRFPYGGDRTAMALVTRLEAPKGAEWLDERGADGALSAVILSRPDRMAFLDWDSSALGNNTGEIPANKLVAVAVGAPSAVAGGKEARALVFSYPRSDFLLSHDPTLGFEYAAPEKPSILPVKWFVFLGVGAVVLGGGWYARKRGWIAVAAAWAAERWAALAARLRALRRP